MRLLQVTPTAVYPPTNGGQQRMHGLVTSRSEADDVLRFAQCGFSVSERQLNPHKIADDYQEYRYRNYAHSVPAAVMNRFDAPPVLTATVLNILQPVWLRREAEAADVVQVEHPWQFPHVHDITPIDTPVVYSSHNFESAYHSALAERQLTRPLYLAVKRLDTAAARHADLVVTTTDRDATLYREHGVETPVYVAPNAVAVDDLNPIDGEQSTKRGTIRAIFVGSDHPPNVDAVENLLTIARETHPKVAFEVVGEVANRFDGDSVPDTVELTGFVEDLEEVYDRTDIALNPVTTGAGSNVKLPEYFARGLAVVTTPFGHRGFPAEEGTHLVVADLPEFPDAIQRLATSYDERQQLGNNAIALVKSDLNWDVVSQSLLKRLRSLAID